MDMCNSYRIAMDMLGMHGGGIARSGSVSNAAMRAGLLALLNGVSIILLALLNGVSNC